MKTTRRSFFGVIAGAVAAVFGASRGRASVAPESPKIIGMDALEDIRRLDAGREWYKRLRYRRMRSELQLDGRILVWTQGAERLDGPWIDLYQN